jgi:hypothetical protein
MSLARSIAIVVTSCVSAELGAQVAASPDTWWENPCVEVNEAEVPTGKRIALDAVSFLVPSSLKLVSRRQFEIELREVFTRVRARLARDGAELYREYDRPNLRYHYCQQDVAGRMAEAFSFRQGPAHGFAVLWPDAYRDEWLTIVIMSEDPEKTGRLRRQVLASLVFPNW